MSSQQPFNTQTSVAEVQHIHYLSDHIGALYLSEEYSDVTLVVDAHRFPGHRVILAARSEYFRALLYGGMKESQLSEIELKDTPLAAFKYLLRYIYTGHIALGNLKDELILEILGLSDQYGFQDLETAISDYLRAVLSVRNVCLIYDTASLYQLPSLTNACLAFLDRQATEVIHHESFATLSPTGIKDIISRDSFCATEVEIFKAIVRWVQNNPGEDHSVILSSVRLSLMSTPDLMKVVRPTNLVPPDVLLDAIQSKTECRDMELKYRGYLIPEENVATQKHGAQVLVGEVKSALLDGDNKNYDMERGFSRHPIDDSQDKGIIVRLGMQCIINHFRMLLWDRDQRAYSYYIDVSMDQNDWVRVVDHSKYYCRSWQDLYFPAKVVRYIRIVGTHNTVNKVFHVVSLEAYYTQKAFELTNDGVVIPKCNVATIPMSACVIEGVCRSRNALLNGDTNNYDWDSGYTCHQLGSGAIVVQLGQPYALSSMRLLLWDCDDRSYSYYIEVSVNEREWELVCDRSREPCRGWQTITFPRRPVVYIRIVGTHNTVNEVFHCVHFECPAVTEIGPASPSTPSSSTASSSASSEGDTSGGGGGGDGDVAIDDDVVEGSPASMPMGASACSMARATNSSSSSNSSNVSSNARQGLDQLSQSPPPPTVAAASASVTTTAGATPPSPPLSNVGGASANFSRGSSVSSHHSSPSRTEHEEDRLQGLGRYPLVQHQQQQLALRPQQAQQHPHQHQQQGMGGAIPRPNPRNRCANNSLPPD